MANPQTPYIKDSEQAILNKSFDPAFSTIVTQMLQYNGSALTRMPTPLIDSSFDYIGFTNADANGNYQTWTFKTGGASGTTIRTLTLTYDASGNITSLLRT